MIETMYAAKGIGLAATQVDVHQRVLVIDVSAGHDQPQVFINPEILSRDGLAPAQEGCLSLPGIYDKVERATHIRVRALGRDGEPFELEAEGLAAVCIQHEMDHLDGKVFVDYLSELKRQLIRRRLEKERRLRSICARLARARRLSRRAVTAASRSLQLAFAGTPQFAVPALDALHASRHAVRAVFTQADRGAGRGQSVQASPVKQRALELGLPVHQPATFRSTDAQAALAASRPDVFVVVAYGLILPPAALEVPPLGCLNIHASLLPRWRGAAPVQRAILAGDTTTGVTIMRMEPGLDTGPVLAESRTQILAGDTAQSLAGRLADLGAALIVAMLDRLADGPVAAVAQSPDGVTYAAKVGKSEALIDWRQDAAADCAPSARVQSAPRRRDPLPRRAAAHLGGRGPLDPAAPGAAEHGAEPGTVLHVSPVGIDVACGSGVLRVTRLQAPGRKVLDARQFANSSPLSGVVLGRP